MVGSVGWPVGWVGLDLRITPASYLSFFFFSRLLHHLGKVPTNVKQRETLVVVFEVISAVVCVASMH